jgi:hypothetical protein
LSFCTRRADWSLLVQWNGDAGIGFDPAQMQERGYLLKEPPEAREAMSANKRDQVA